MVEFRVEARPAGSARRCPARGCHPPGWRRRRLSDRHALRPGGEPASARAAIAQLYRIKGRPVDPAIPLDRGRPRADRSVRAAR
ncbi:MAG: hypothetical protein MZV64_72920 [Ignavibacteriales bacterium]|nr:hypothetical protein [Ignavibacteriales bacterium]